MKLRDQITEVGVTSKDSRGLWKLKREMPLPEDAPEGAGLANYVPWQQLQADSDNPHVGSQDLTPNTPTC